MADKWSPKWPTSGMAFWALKVLKLELFMNNYDPLEVYKLRSKFYKQESKFRIFKSKQLQTWDREEQSTEVNPIDWDKLRWMFNKVLVIFINYLFIKAYLTMFIMMVVSKHDHRMEKYVFFDRSTLKQLEDMLGNPLSELRDLSLFLYLNLGNLMYVFIIGSSNYYKRKPLNIPAIRFIIDSERELKRCDLAISGKLDELLTSLDFFCLEQLKKSNCPCGNVGDLNDSDDSQILWNYLNRIRSNLLGFKKNVSLLRPRNFSQEWFEEEQRTLINYLLYPLVLNTVWSILTGPEIFSWALEGKCQVRNFKGLDCTPSKAFTYQEYLFVFEIFILFILGTQTFSLHMALVFILVKGQMSLIENIHSEMLKVVDYLRDVNSRRAVTKFSYHAHQTDLLEGGQEAGEEEEDLESQMNNNRTCDLKSDLILLEALVKMLVTRDELRYGSRFLSELMQLFLLNGLTSIIIIFLTGFAQEQISKTFIRTNILATWLLLNVIILVCSRIYAKFTKISPLYFSIMAENLPRTNMTYCAEDLTSTLWHKLTIQSAESINELCSVRPFNLTLTYRKTIEINFFLIGLFSLAKIKW